MKTLKQTDNRQQGKKKIVEERERERKKKKKTSNMKIIEQLRNIDKILPPST